MKRCWAIARAVRAVRHRNRCSSTQPDLVGRRYERIRVPCRSNDEVLLDVYHPTSRTASRETLPKVLIHLPRGPLLSNEAEESSTCNELARTLPDHHLVSIKYRLTVQHRYPTPIHDALTGYDWVLNNILTKRAVSRPGRADLIGRLAACGELIGGGLASMLALTECRAGEPGIVAAAVNNPIIDWVSLSDEAGKNAEPVVGKLLELRRTLFPKPDRAFDPFASPALFFRTAGVDVPVAPYEPLLDDMSQLSLHEREESTRNFDTANQAASPSSDEVALRMSRKASRRYPSPSLSLRVPAFHISSTSLAPFSTQAEELAHLLRQSHVRQEREKRPPGESSFGRKVLMDDEEDAYEDDQSKRLKAQQHLQAKEKVQLHVHRTVGEDDYGLWEGTSEAGRQRLRKVARWVEERTA